ncbi:MAG: PAS domain S-box protein [Leptolyngbya sp. SIOISBB]|nr:PAS domain S-box protein [Leptolyngbya sp. SIOISBB]
MTSATCSKILIVDDQPENIEVLTTHLKQDYTLIIATESEQARKLAHTWPLPDLILLDVVMPQVSGYDLCAEFRQDDITKDIPIIFLTGLSEASEEAKGFQIGGNDYIVKPVDPTVLKARIHNHLFVKQLLDQQAQVKKTLAQTNQQLQAVLNAVPGMVSWVSRDLTYLGCNQALADACQLQPADFIGCSIDFQDEIFNFREFMESFFVSTETVTFQEVTVESQGVQSPYYVAAQKYDDGNAAVCVGINIAEQKQAKAALRQSETRFRNLVEQINDWVWETNLDSQFVYLSPKVQEITGHSMDELLGKEFTDLMSADEAVRFTTILSYFIRSHQPFTQIEVNCCHKTGRSLILEISGSPILTPGSTFGGYRGIARDITVRKQAELDIRKALTQEKELSELKTRFISMASHEFRTPLTTIMASAESLERYRHKFSDEKQTIILKRIQDSVEYITKLLSDTLTAGKAEAGKFRCQTKPVDLRKFCLNLVEEMHIIQSDQVTPILFEYSGETSEGEADEKLLNHILINLLSNAVKYSPEQTPVKFTLTVNHDTATFQVTDEGLGISQEDQRYLFEPFHRGNNVGNISGTGLGLMIAKQAVTAYQGKITCSSELGLGTTFIVTLPFTTMRSTHD